LKGTPDSASHVACLAQRSSYVCLPAVFAATEQEKRRVRFKRQ
jgi:hypothetical protein